MNSNKKILLKFGLYLLTGIIIILVGVSKIFAAEYSFDYSYIQTYYNNNGSSLTAVSSQWNESLQAYVSNSIPTTANSYGAGVAFNSPIPLLANHTYTISLSFVDRNNIALSSKNHIAIGASAYNAAISRYGNSSYHATTEYSTVSNNSILSFAFTAEDSNSYIFVPWTTTSNANQTYVLTKVVMEDLGASGVSQSQINTSLTNQTNILNSSITNAQNNIINNQNQNTQQQIESQKVCETVDKNNVTDNGKYLRNSGDIGNSAYYGVTGYINIHDAEVTVQTVFDAADSGTHLCYYSKNKSFISCQNIYNLSTLTIPSNAYYLRTSIFNYQNNNKPILKVCRNGNSALNDSLNDLNDTMKDDDTSASASDTADFITEFDTNTFGLTSIITAPLNLIQSLTSSSCTPLHLPLPYMNNKYLDLPCMSSIYSEHFGSFFTIYQTITYGIIAYWVCVRIFNYVKDFKNPEHDEIEVVDL